MGNIVDIRGYPEVGKYKIKPLIGKVKYNLINP